MKDSKRSNNSSQAQKKNTFVNLFQTIWWEWTICNSGRSNSPVIPSEKRKHFRIHKKTFRFFDRNRDIYYKCIFSSLTPSAAFSNIYILKLIAKQLKKTWRHMLWAEQSLYDATVKNIVNARTVTYYIILYLAPIPNVWWMAKVNSLRIIREFVVTFCAMHLVSNIFHKSSKNCRYVRSPKDGTFSCALVSCLIRILKWELK